MLGLVNSFWVSIWSVVLHLFSLFSRCFFMFTDEKTVNFSPESDAHKVKDEENKALNQIEEKITPMSNSEVENVVNTSTSKYQFYGGNSLCAYIEQPQTAMNFTVHELFVISHNGFSPKRGFVAKEGSFFKGENRGFSDNGFSPKHDLVRKGGSFFEGENRGFSDDGFSPKYDLVMEEGSFFEGENQGFSDNGFRPKHDLVMEEGSIFEGENRGFSGGKIVVLDGISREEEVVNHVEIENIDLLKGGKEVVELGQTDEFVSGFACHERVQTENSDCIDADNLMISGENLVNCEEKDGLSTNQDEPENSDSKSTDENPVNSDLNCEEKDGLSRNQEELSEKDDTFTLDEILEKVEFSDEIQSIRNSDDFWSTIYKDDCEFGTQDEITVDYDEYCLNSLDDSSNDPNNVSSSDVSVKSTEVGEVESSFIELDPNSLRETTHAELERVLIDESSDSENEGDQESTEDGDVQMGNDVLLEQRELIRQMKKEMRQLKVNGLPTILEESESPRVEDDLRPLRIDERIGHKDRMDEILIFHKRYLEKMRKLDILSQQTMYAIGLLQLKSQDANKKLPIPMMKSLMHQNFWSHKLRKHEGDTVQKMIRDLQRELEVVYVGQLCLSWEILKWQHHKVEELQTHDPDGFRQYNQVAGEFQKFQVLLQRFTEDEPYHQGPRVQHYLKSRCGLLNLLQVPLIKDDPRSEWRGDGEGAISISMMKEVIASSMRSFWDFLRADKDEVHHAHATSLIGIHGVHTTDLQDPSDTDLLADIRSTLHKKEKRLKDLVRSGNCIVRKFQKHQEQRLSPEMFLAQVELRLVSRVLNMSKLKTEQLLWCHKKMNKTNIVGRKVYVESSFSLFPC